MVPINKKELRIDLKQYLVFTTCCVPEHESWIDKRAIWNEKHKGTNCAVCVEIPFTVTVSKNDSSPVGSALVTLQGDSNKYYTDGLGQVTLFAPSTQGEYIITASLEGFMNGTATLTVLNIYDPICSTDASLYNFFICLAFWIIIFLVGVLIVIVVVLKYKR